MTFGGTCGVGASAPSIKRCMSSCSSVPQADLGTNLIKQGENVKDQLRGSRASGPLLGTNVSLT